MAQHVPPTGPQVPFTDTLRDQPLEQVMSLGTDLLGQFQTFATGLFRTWNLYQIGIALALFALAHILRALLGPRIRTWMATRENWPKWRMRILAIVHRRLRAIFFVALIWLTVLVMREVTWPSRSYLLGIIATLALAWLSVVFLTRLI